MVRGNKKSAPKTSRRRRDRLTNKTAFNDKLKELYGDPNQPGSLGGVAAFARANKVPYEQAKKALESSLGYSLHKPVRHKFETSLVLVFGRDEQWATDLVETGNIAKHNRGIRYLLVVIDVFSKFAWVEPIKSKTGKAVTEAFGKILKKAEGRRPQKLQTDDGKEFYNTTFQELLKKKQIHHFSTRGDTKASVVERFNRTFKQKMYRYFTVHNTLSFLPVLQPLIHSYNHTYHRTIRTTPAKVTPEIERKVWNTMYGPMLSVKKKKPTPLQVGDRVRLTKKHRLFKKGYLPRWTEEVFVVARVIPSLPGTVVTYRIKEWDGTLLEGTFYREDLQKVEVKDDDLFRIEKVLNARVTECYCVGKTGLLNTTAGSRRKRWYL